MARRDVSRCYPSRVSCRRLASTPEELREGKVCNCAACERDGQHEPECAAHEEPPAECDCGLLQKPSGPTLN